MQTQRGFVSTGILIAIILAIVVLGGGAYYVMQQQAPTQTASDNFDNAQTLPTTNNPARTTVDTSVKTTQTQNTGTQKATATIDKNSLTTNSVTPTITGTASANIGIFIAKGKVTVTSPITTDSQNYAWRYWGHLGKCQSTTGDFCGFDILNGRWSTTVFGPGLELKDGVYTVIITDSIIGKDSANVLATGTLTIAGSINNGLSSISISSPVAGTSVSQGSSLTISWSSQNAPTGAYVQLSLVPVSGSSGDYAAISTAGESLPLTGNKSWTIPSVNLCSVDGCKIRPSPGQYRISASILKGDTGVGIGTTDSAIFNITTP